MTDEHRGASRREALRCMTAGAAGGVLWVMSGGVPVALAKTPGHAHAKALAFAQISDTHFGFNAPANMDVTGTAHKAIAALSALKPSAAFVLHTGDLTHNSKPEQFDAAAMAFSALKLDVHYVPGEHDVADAEQTAFKTRYGAKTKGDGWYSFDHSGVHFIALVNVYGFSKDGLGNLGAAQIAWLKDDVAHLSSSTPIVVFAHVPLWAVYPQWGWATGDSAEAIGLLRRFGSVTVLNGHIHQVLQKVEGDVSFYSALSTAYPQPAPGAAPNPGPKLLPAAELPAALGLRSVVVKPHAALIADSHLSEI